MNTIQAESLALGQGCECDEVTTMVWSLFNLVGRHLTEYKAMSYTQHEESSLSWATGHMPAIRFGRWKQVNQELEEDPGIIASPRPVWAI